MISVLRQAAAESVSPLVRAAEVARGLPGRRPDVSPVMVCGAGFDTLWFRSGSAGERRITDEALAFGRMSA
ncbi:hypothetical protein ACFVAF_32785 [Streptomyces sp. NPDC057596]|uniref:hypothetical protein n=1 Tax=Streptomyces sp. NPDC057596 TaxID=3346178 RepID=UPI003679C7C1